MKNDRIHKTLGAAVEAGIYDSEGYMPAERKAKNRKDRLSLK